LRENKAAFKAKCNRGGQHRIDRTTLRNLESKYRQFEIERRSTVFCGKVDPKEPCPYTNTSAVHALINSSAS
jgi:hypothetical protein